MCASGLRNEMSEFLIVNSPTRLQKPWPHDCTVQQIKKKRCRWNSTQQVFEVPVTKAPPSFHCSLFEHPSSQFKAPPWPRHSSILPICSHVLSVSRSRKKNTENFEVRTNPSPKFKVCVYHPTMFFAEVTSKQFRLFCNDSEKVRLGGRRKE